MKRLTRVILPALSLSPSPAACRISPTYLRFKFGGYSYHFQPDFAVSPIDVAESINKSNKIVPHGETQFTKYGRQAHKSYLPCTLKRARILARSFDFFGLISQYFCMFWSIFFASPAAGQTAEGKLFDDRFETIALIMNKFK